VWVFLSDSFLSIVQKPGQTDFLTVRARRPGDIERVCPEAKVQVGLSTDYKYRAIVARSEVADALARQVHQLHYANFKATVEDPKRHEAYMGVWAAMHGVQR
jgi:hypothetical protein